MKGTKKDAQREQARLLASIDSGAFVEPTKTTVAEFFGYWLEAYAKSNVGAKTFERYSEIVRNSIVPYSASTRSLGSSRSTSRPSTATP